MAVELELRWLLSWIADVVNQNGPLLIGLHLSGLLDREAWLGRDGVGLAGMASSQPRLLMMGQDHLG